MKKFLGYTVVNTKTKKFVDYNGSEYEESFSSWHTKKGPQEILDEIDWYIKHYNNKYSRKMKENRKNFKIGKLFVEVER
jgi:hypothetical protein